MISSCSIHKRHYMPGYYVQWNGKKQDLKFKGNAINHDLVLKNSQNDTMQLLIASHNKDILIPKNTKQQVSQILSGLSQVNKVKQTAYKANNFQLNKDQLSFKKSAKNSLDQFKDKARKKVGTVAIFAVAFGVLGSFLFPSLFGLIAILLGITGAVLSIENKEKNGHIGIPIFAICLGIFDMLLSFLWLTPLTAFFIVLALSLIFLVIIK